MRWEQALKIKQNWTSEQARNDLERLIITGERPADKVVGLACQALDRQIPKKPVTNAVIYHCPNCNDVLGDIFKRPFCDECGQALDWSDHPTEKGGEEE